MLNLTASGNLGRDAELKTVGGSTVCNFSVGAQSGFGDKKQTEWISCALWGRLGESVSEFLKKGVSVTVGGELSTREYNGKNYMELRVNQIRIHGGNDQQKQQQGPAQYQQPQQQAAGYAQQQPQQQAAPGYAQQQAQQPQQPQQQAAPQYQQQAPQQQAPVYQQQPAPVYQQQQAQQQQGGPATDTFEDDIPF